MPYDDQILVNDGSDNDLLPGGTKPLPEPMLSRNYRHPSQYNFTENAQDMLANSEAVSKEGQLTHLHKAKLSQHWFG